MFNRDDDFATGVSGFKIADRFRRLTEWVASVDDRNDFAGFEKRFQENQIGLIGFHGWHETDALAPGLRPARPQDHVFKQQGRLVNPAVTQTPWGFRARW